MFFFADLETGRPLADGKVQHIIEHQGRKVHLRKDDDGGPFLVVEIVMIMGMVVVVFLVVTMI